MQVREKSPLIRYAVFDGKLIGQCDPLFNEIVPGTCPDWCPAVTEQVESLQLREVRPGEFIGVGEDLFFGEAQAWRKLERGDRVLRLPGGELAVVSAEDFFATYEPA